MQLRKASDQLSYTPSNTVQLGVLIALMETKTFTVLANRTALLVSKNVEKNLKTIVKTIASAADYVEISPVFVLFLS